MTEDELLNVQEKVKEETEKVNENVEVKTEPVVEINKEEVKTEVEPVVDEDAGINAVVKVAEEKVAQNVQEDGKNIELADNIVKEAKIDENSNLPVDVKPYLEIIKEKLKGAGRVVMNVLEMVGELVENIFKKKN